MPAATRTRGTATGSASRARAWVVRLAAARPPTRPVSVSVVVPATDARHVDRLLQSLTSACPQHLAPEVVVVDDREGIDPPLRFDSPLPVRVVRSGGVGKSVARNVGMRAASAEWVVVLDEDQTVGTAWFEELVSDLAHAGRAVAGVAAVVVAASPETVRLGADVAYRRLVALSLGGFPGRFPRGTGHDDVELALRMARAGWTVTSGRRSAALPPQQRGVMVIEPSTSTGVVR